MGTKAHLEGDAYHLNPRAMVAIPAYRRWLTWLLLCGPFSGLLSCQSSLHIAEVVFPSPDAARSLAPIDTGTMRLAEATSLASSPTLHTAAQPVTATPTSVTPSSSSPIFSQAYPTSTGERVRFFTSGAHWYAVSSSQPSLTLPVVSQVALGPYLCWLQGQDRWTVKAQLHLMPTTTSPPQWCVYVGKAGLLGGSSDSEDDRKPAAKRLKTIASLPVSTAGNARSVDFRQLLPKIYTSITGVGMSFDVMETHGDWWLVGAPNTAARSPRVAQTVQDVIVPYMSWLCSKTTMRATIFGKSSWEHYLGDVGEVPTLPATMGQVLTAPCPFWPSHRVYETHLLTLIPATVDGQRFTLNLLEDLIQSPKNGGHATKYEYYNKRIKRKFGEIPPAGAYWALVTRDILPGSRGRGYASQQALVAKHPGYTLPSALAVSTSILCHHVRSGERLLGDNPMTYTRCKDVVAFQCTDFPVVVGEFSRSGGLYLNAHIFRNDHGIVSFRKF